MKMSKYLNKRIFICLSLALIFLILASFVASSGGDQKEKGGAALSQDPMGAVTRGTDIDFRWVVTQPGPPFYTGDYCLLIEGPASKQEQILKKDPINSSEIFSGFYRWTVPDDKPKGNYTAYIRVPCVEDIMGSYTRFKVVKTVLVIQKFNDTNQNNKVDVGVDERLQGWKFQVTDPNKKTSTQFTDVNGEIRIEVPDEYAGKEYTVEEILQPRWKAILPIEQPVRVKVPKGVTTTVPFLNIYDPNTKLIIQKFDDTNRNNRIDDGRDKRLQGWKFKVTDPGGNTRPYYTKSDGKVVIDVPPEYAGKEYTVEEILQPGWKSILPIKQTVNVPVGETKTVQFLNSQTLLIIQKFDDSNRNDRIDSNDKGLKGWDFNVTDPGGNTKPYSTNIKGEIVIVVPGEYAGKEYIIEETLPPKWESVLPIEQPVHVKVPLGEAKTVQFLNRIRNTTLIIQKFSDRNQNGEVDSEDERLPDWNFNVTDPAGRTTFHPTNGKGEIIIVVPEKHAGKEYIIKETLLPDWEPVLPIEQPVHVNVPMGETETVQFLNKKGTLLIIQKFNDTNQNGKVDEGIDDRLEGWNFSVTDPAGNTTPHCTNDKGEILIDVPPKYVGKEYTIVETLRPGWSAVDGSTKTEKPSKGKPTPVRFLNQRILPSPSPSPTITPPPPPGHLKIQKFYDPNVNKVQDPGEQGLPNWNFRISPNVNDGIVTTDANGVCRRKIPGGIYTITEEPRGCRWTNTTDMTQKVDVPAGKEAIALFGNYLPCSVPPGCPWFSADENLNVSKSVNPCSVALGKEEEVTVHLRICVDPKHILNGTKVRNISVIETLHNYFSVVNGSFSVEPSSKPRTNPDGTTTIRWNISSLCCEEWHVSFNVTVAFALPIDVTESYGVASKVIYDDPNSEDTKVVKELPIPAGKLLFVLPTPTPTPTATSSPTPKPPGFEALLAIAGLLAVGYMMWRRKR
jgi:hypothetical protein